MIKDAMASLLTYTCLVGLFVANDRLIAVCYLACMCDVQGAVIVGCEC